ncbi:MAG: hypothetical protein FJW38_10000 [Acidobacteria bacterium]|nr:hypothetical protein [Acidobacteriota bacterium]
MWTRRSVLASAVGVSGAGKPNEQNEFVGRDKGKIAVGFDAPGDLTNTVVGCATVHGDQLGGLGLPFKWPFMYEPLIRIPL